MNGLRMYNAEWNKSDKDKNLIVLVISGLEKNEQIKQNKKRLIETEVKQRSEGWLSKGRLGRWVKKVKAKIVNNIVIRLISLHGDKWFLELVGWSHCRYKNVESLYCIPETNVSKLILIINCTYIKKNK